MAAIFDTDGKELGEVPLTEKQQALLDAGENVVVIYHTPQMLSSLLGHQSGSFTLTVGASEQITASDPASFQKYADLQRSIKAARGIT